MPRPHVSRAGKRATFGQRNVQYSPFRYDVPRSYVLVSDPWGYLQVSIQKEAKRHPSLIRQYEDAEYFVNLAHEYYQAASLVQSQTKALLYYYGYLNLSKAYLSMAGVQFGARREYHGLSLRGRARVRILARSPNNINIFPDLMFHLKRINVQNQILDPGRVLHVLPEIHEIGIASGAFRRRSFVRVDVTFHQSETSHKVWYRIAFKKSDRPLVRNLYSRFYSGTRRQALWQIPPDEDHIRFESRRTFRYNRSTREAYRQVCDEVNSMPIFSLLTSQGYRHYVLLRAWPFDQIGASFVAMFWLGSLVRYRPRELRMIMNTVYAPVLSEFVAMNPVQFLYQMTNYMTKSECVKPYAHV